MSLLPPSLPPPLLLLLLLLSAKEVLACSSDDKKAKDDGGGLRCFVSHHLNEDFAKAFPPVKVEEGKWKEERCGEGSESCMFARKVLKNCFRMDTEEDVYMCSPGKKVPRLQSIENAKGTDTACGQWREEEWGDNSMVVCFCKDYQCNRNSINLTNQGWKNKCAWCHKENNQLRDDCPKQEGGGDNVTLSTMETPFGTTGDTTPAFEEGRGCKKGEILFFKIFGLSATVIILGLFEKF